MCYDFTSLVHCALCIVILCIVVLCIVVLYLLCYLNQWPNSVCAATSYNPFHLYTVLVLWTISMDSPFILLPFIFAQDPLEMLNSEISPLWPQLVG